MAVGGRVVSPGAPRARRAGVCSWEALPSRSTAQGAPSGGCRGGVRGSQTALLGGLSSAFAPRCPPAPVSPCLPGSWQVEPPLAPSPLLSRTPGAPALSLWGGSPQATPLLGAGAGEGACLCDWGAECAGRVAPQRTSCGNPPYRGRRADGSGHALRVGGSSPEPLRGPQAQPGVCCSLSRCLPAPTLCGQRVSALSLSLK